MSSSAIQSSTFICRSCSRHIRPQLLLPFSATPRTFSTTSSVHSTSPYSPHYIDIPFPPQRYAQYQPRAKGKRPVPREIFPKKNNIGEKKATAEYLALASKEPTTRKNPGENAPATEKAYISWKSKMAASRRKNIREGIMDLYAEKLKRDKIIAERSEAKQKRRAQLLAEEDPLDVQLTNPSIISALKQKTTLTDPDREVRLAEKRAKYEAIQAAKVNERREELHELYIRSHSFILSEKQLDIAIEAAFGPLSETETIKIMPPDSRRITERSFKQARDPEEFSVLEDDIVMEEFSNALTGGSKREKLIEDDEDEEALGKRMKNMSSQFEMSTFGYIGDQNKDTNFFQPESLFPTKK